MDNGGDCHHSHCVANIYQRRYYQTPRLGLLLRYLDTGKKPRDLGRLAARQARTDGWHGQVTAIIGESFHTVATASGLGNQFELLNRRRQVAALKWSFLGHVPVVNGIGFGKLAVVAFLLRIQDRRHPKKKWFLYFIGVSGCVINLITTLLLLFQCVPLDRQWNGTIPGVCSRILRIPDMGYVAGSEFRGGSVGSSSRGGAHGKINRLGGSQ